MCDCDKNHMTEMSEREKGKVDHEIDRARYPRGKN